MYLSPGRSLLGFLGWEAEVAAFEEGLRSRE